MKSSPNGRGAYVMFVSTELDVDSNPLVNGISDCPLPSLQGPGHMLLGLSDRENLKRLHTCAFMKTRLYRLPS
jgi:hypothetical protein